MHVQKNLVQKSLGSPAWQGIGVLVAFLSLAVTIVSFLLNLLMEYGEIANSLNKSGWDEEIVGIWKIAVLTFKDAYFLVGLATIILIFSSPLFAKAIALDIPIKKLRMLQKWALNFCLFCVALAATFQRVAAVFVLSIALIRVLDCVQENYKYRDASEGRVIFSPNFTSSHSHLSKYPKAERVTSSYDLTTGDDCGQLINPQTILPERTQPIPRPTGRQVQLENSPKTQGA